MRGQTGSFHAACEQKPWVMSPLGLEEGEFSFPEGPWLVLWMSKINQQGLSCALLIASSLSASLREDFSGFSLRPSFSPKSLPGDFVLKLERRVMSQQENPLLIVNYTATPHGLLIPSRYTSVNHQSIREFRKYLPCAQNWHLRTWLTFQVLPVDDVRARKGLEDR